MSDWLQNPSSSHWVTLPFPGSDEYWINLNWMGKGEEGRIHFSKPLCLAKVYLFTEFLCKQIPFTQWDINFFHICVEMCVYAYVYISFSVLSLCISDLRTSSAFSMFYQQFFKGFKSKFCVCALIKSKVLSFEILILQCKATLVFSNQHY